VQIFKICLILIVLKAVLNVAVLTDDQLVLDGLNPKKWPRKTCLPKLSIRKTSLKKVPKTAPEKKKYALDTCTVFDSSSSETTPAGNGDDTTAYPENTNPISLVYFPLIVNEAYDPDFDPQTAEFCSTWNFVYSSEQVNKLHGLTEANIKDNLEKVCKVIKDTWKRKRDERLKRSRLITNIFIILYMY
jgi:phospholipase A2